MIDMTTDEIVRKLPIFLEGLATGHYRDQELQAFDEINAIVSHVTEARHLLRDRYFLELYDRNATGRQSLLYLVDGSIKHATSSFAYLMAETLIEIYDANLDLDALDKLINIVLAFRFTDLINLENEGRQIRFQSNQGSFTIGVDTIYPHIRTNIFKLLLKKYCRLLVDEGPPNPQELLPIIDRLNALLRRLESHQSSELSRFTSLLPFSISKSVEYDSILAAKIFDGDVNAVNFDSKMFEQFQIPLFPTINEDKIEIDAGKITFVNEGPGYLPHTKIRIVVGTDEFELGEQSRLIAPNTKHVLYISKESELAIFLSMQEPNIDVKLIFAFRKFNHSYEYSLLSGLVGDWQSKFPTSESHSEPDFDLVFPHEMPLHTLPPKEFERLCLWIVEGIKADSGSKKFHKVVWLGEDGGGEMGRDIIAIESTTGKSYVFQCKRVEKFTPSEIEKELESFQGYVSESSDILPDEYVFFVSAALTAESKKRGDKWAKSIGMSIDYWPKSTIDRLIREDQSVRKRFWDIVQKSS